MQVVCAETYRMLFAERGETEAASSREGGGLAHKSEKDHRDSDGTLGMFLVPQPSQHMPDWAMFDSHQRKTPKNSDRGNTQQQATSSDTENCKVIIMKHCRTGLSACRQTWTHLAESI